MGVPFGVGPPVGSSGKPSSPTDIKRSPLRGRPAVLGLLWYFLCGALCGVGLPVPLHLRPRAVPPQRLLLKATSYITALSCRDRSIRLSSCKAIFCTYFQNRSATNYYISVQIFWKQWVFYVTLHWFRVQFRSKCKLKVAEDISRRATLLSGLVYRIVVQMGGFEPRHVKGVYWRFIVTFRTSNTWKASSKAWSVR